MALRNAFAAIATAARQAQQITQLGTEGAAPPAITGTGIMGYLRAIYEVFTGTGIIVEFDGVAQPVLNMASLVPVKYDEIALSSYTTDNQPQTVVYKQATVTVATLTITYSGGAAGGNITSVVRT